MLPFLGRLHADYIYYYEVKDEVKEIDKCADYFVEEFKMILATQADKTITNMMIYPNSQCKALFKDYSGNNFKNVIINSVESKINTPVFITYFENWDLYNKTFSLYISRSRESIVDRLLKK